jgi:hypothetical protein
MSDTVWNALIGAAVAVILAYIQQRSQAAINAKVVEKTNEVKKAVDSHQEDMKERLINIAQTVQSTKKVLVSQAVLNEKRMIASIARAKADVTKHPLDMEAANMAEQDYLSHRAEGNG